MAITTKAERERIRHIRNRLLALVSKNSPCGVADEHKEAVRVYVQTWILPHIEVLAGNVLPNSPDDLGTDDVSTDPENWHRFNF